MSEHCGYIVQITELRKHKNADRLQVATIYGNNVIVDNKVKLGAVGVYFPTDLQLSEAFCKANDLVRRKDGGGYLDPVKRNIRTIRLRGEISDGLYLPISCLMEFTKISDLVIGDTIEVLNGQEICRKYIPYSSNKVSNVKKEIKSKKIKESFFPTFYEHVDTKQLAYNLGDFHNGDVVQITLKMHGCSGRTAYLPKIKYHRSWFDKIFHKKGAAYKEYEYVVGSRRCVLDESYQGYYKDNSFREILSKKIEGQLYKGENIYYEIVGFQGYKGNPIMPSVSNSKVQDENFIRKYGENTNFTYGCIFDHGYYDENPCCRIYVYRMTMVNEEGKIVEYSPAQIKYRCDQMGLYVVPEFETFVIPENVNPEEYVLRKAEQYYDGADPVGKTHIREGVVLRILNRNDFVAYKHKNIYFKQLEGIYKTIAAAPDIEEAQEEEK